MLNLPFLLKNDEITLSYPAAEVKKRFQMAAILILAGYEAENVIPRVPP